jgi:endonuclease-3
MRPETRVERWLEIARICRDDFAGDLNCILAQPFGQAKKALRRFPCIGEPGAEKISCSAERLRQGCLWNRTDCVC